MQQLRRVWKVCVEVAVLHLLAISLILPAPLLSQNAEGRSSIGVAWRVIGLWRIAGQQAAIADGTAISPGSLLEPQESSGNHSITILLPDGQRVLYECYAPRDCARGFRVPALYRKPDGVGVDLLARVHAMSESKMGRNLSGAHDADSLPRDEAVAIVNSAGKAEVGGLAGSLSDGSYSYVIRNLSRGAEMQRRGEIEKRGRTISVPIPTEGLYKVSIFDRLNTPRIDLLLAAVRQPRGAKVLEEFEHVDALLKDWNEDYQGWPRHEFRRAYLGSVMLGIKPMSAPLSESRSAVKGIGAADTACEPSFEPTPGVFKADTEVKLRCGSAEATIRFTVDGSQPLEGALTYRAPIIVKGTGLTIKAYATAPGKKDSPVVTGIYRIGE